jgi:hypothetical protein
MRSRPRSMPARPPLPPLLAVVLGVLSGALLVALVGAPISRSDGPDNARAASSVEVTHVPPLLTAPGETVELAYDAYCLPAETDDDLPCHATGSVHARTGAQGAFIEIPLRRDRFAPESRLVAILPERIARSPLGFEYYAVIADPATGATTTLPSGGPSSPQRSIPLGKPIEVELGHHSFGATRRADARVAWAHWGDGPFDAGLEQGRNLPPIGGASFDVASEGTVVVLDEANRRALRFEPGQSRPSAIPLDISGTIADLALAPERLYVLETVGGRGHEGALRAFTASGRPLSLARLPERAYRVRIGPDRAPVLLSQGSSQWVRAELPRTGSVARLRGGRAGRPLPDGREVVVLRTGDEIRVALLSPGGTARTWRIRSATSVAEVQLAEPLGSRLVLVARLYTDTRDEFLVLVLGPTGVVERFTVPAREWAETAPLSRFRLAGSSLYQLGSMPEGLFVDRYDLEVK